MVVDLDVPPGTLLLFKPRVGPVAGDESFRSLGTVIRAQRWMDRAAEAGVFDDDRTVLECEGVEASSIPALLAWPIGEPFITGIAKFGETTYPAILQVRASACGLRAVLRRVH